VHHRIYISKKEPWDYPDDLLVTLCEGCHILEREERTMWEKSLLEELQKNYFALDIGQLAQGIYDGELKIYIDRYLECPDRIN
jgi:hypothetical protein